MFAWLYSDLYTALKNTKKLFKGLSRMVFGSDTMLNYVLFWE